MSEDIFIIKNYLKGMEFSIKYQMDFEINYEQTKEFYNSIHKLLKEIEERDKYNITTLPFEELKEMIEQNKNISIFGKEYISKDKIKQILDITATVLGDNYEMDFIDVRDAVADTITTITRKLLEGD